MVYIGKNILGNGKEESFYFQDSVSVILFGLIGEAAETENCQVSSFTTKDCGISIVSIAEAATLVAEAAEKAKSFGYPKFRKITGQWKQKCPNKALEFALCAGPRYSLGPLSWSLGYCE